jgi:hypothetical protein
VSGLNPRHKTCCGYQVALKRAALEAFEGRYEAQELFAMVDEQETLAEALKLIQQ